MSSSLRPLRRPPQENVIRKDNPSDYTAPTAKDRVLFINLWFMKFGTTDKLQGAAIFLAIILLIFVFISIVFGFLFDASWAKEAIGWLGTPLLLVIGVAVGRAGNNGNDNSE